MASEEHLSIGAMSILKYTMKRRLQDLERLMTQNIQNINSCKTHAAGLTAWTHMTFSFTGSLVFIDDVTEERSNLLNSEVFRKILSVSDSVKCSKDYWNYPQITVKATLKVKRRNKIQRPNQLSDFNPLQLHFSC